MTERWIGGKKDSNEGFFDEFEDVDSKLFGRLMSFQTAVVDNEVEVSDAKKLFELAADDFDSNAFQEVVTIRTFMGKKSYVE